MQPPYHHPYNHHLFSPQSQAAQMNVITPAMMAPPNYMMLNNQPMVANNYMPQNPAQLN